MMNAGRVIAIAVLISWLGFAPAARVFALPTSAEIEQLKTYCDQNPTSVRELYKLGMYCFVSKRYEEAVGAWKRLLKAKSPLIGKPEKLKVYKGLALAFYKIGKLETSLKCIKLVCLHSPGDAKAERFRDRVSQLVAAKEKKPDAGAPAAATPAASTAPPKPVEPPKPDQATAKAAFDKGEGLYKEAKYLLEQSNPSYEAKFNDAIKEFDVAVAGGYKLAKSLYYVGSARLYRDDEKDDDRNKALDALQKSVKEDQDANTLFDLGQVYGLLDMKDKEIDAFEKALQLREGWAECHFRLALAYDKSKRPDAPRKTFENAKAAIRVKPEYKKKFQEVLKNSEVAKQIAGIVSEIIEKSENDQLTDQETEKYAKKFQEMLGDKNINPDQLKDKEKMKELLQSDKAKELLDGANISDKQKEQAKKLMENPNVQKRLDRLLNKNKNENQ